jgi:hypothetical protein
MGESALPDLVLIHPAVGPEALRRFAPALWREGDSGRPPQGYREISAAFHGLRAFCREGLETTLPSADATLAERVREWVDVLAHGWKFPEVFGVGEVKFWAFLRNRMISWLHEHLAEGRLITGLAAEAPIALLAIGVDASHRAQLRALADASDGRLRPEVAYLAAPAPVPRQTATERRMRKLFFLLQDGWHGVKLIVENLFVRRPKLLIASDARCWQRRRGRSVDVHLEGVWRDGRQRPLRLYYRTNNYDPDVGAMTTGRLAPTYLMHFFFLLAQTSRGFWEVWRIQRQWRQLRDRPEFREALVFDGLPVGEIVCDWLDAQTARWLPQNVRNTRRELYFLRGVRPRAVLLTHEQVVNRPILTAAKRLGIPTVALQLRPFHVWDHAYLLSRRDPEHSTCVPDRLCVFSQEAKAFLVEQGAFDPSAIVVTGDPRGDALAENGAAEERLAESAARMRRRWGVEGDRRVIGLACSPTDCPQALDWLAGALRDRDDAFVLLRLLGDVGIGRDFLAGHGLRWSHALPPGTLEDWRAGIDLLLTTDWTEAAEALARRTPVAIVGIGDRPPLAGPDPGSLVARASDPAELSRILEAALARSGRLPADEAWRRFVDAYYGERDGRASARVMDVLEGLTRRA